MSVMHIVFTYALFHLGETLDEHRILHLADPSFTGIYTKHTVKHLQLSPFTASDRRPTHAYLVLQLVF